MPEAATLIFSSGGVLDMGSYTPYQAIDFQKSLMLLQMSLEDIFRRIVTINSHSQSQPCFVLCDRGLMDGRAYLSAEQWEVLVNEMGLYEQDMMDNRYDLVIHLTTAADGAEKYYTNKNNTARSEDVDVAKTLDQKIRAAWANHPNYYLITNAVKDFDMKMRMAKDYILKQHGFPINTDFSVKYILANANYIFEKIVNRYRLEVFVLTDTFLEESVTDVKSIQMQDKSYSDATRVEMCDYLRKREHNSRLTFLKGKKYYVNGGESYSSKKRNVMWKEYVSYLEMYKAKSNTLTRKRCMVVLTDVYITFESVDYFVEGDANPHSFLIALIQGSEYFKALSKAEQLKHLSNLLPSYVIENMLTDITGTRLLTLDVKHYRLENIAKADWKIDPELHLKIVEAEQSRRFT